MTDRASGDGSGGTSDGDSGEASDGDRHLRRAFELARESAAAGDEPFGSVLVLDGDRVAQARNSVRTDDVTAHPELKLARWAARELDADERARATMYTSTEPCPMCAGAVHNVGLGRVVYATPAPDLAAVAGGEAGPRCADVAPETTVEGPRLRTEGRAVHEEFW